jgi:hypothetical protein
MFKILEEHLSFWWLTPDRASLLSPLAITNDNGTPGPRNSGRGFPVPAAWLLSDLKGVCSHFMTSYIKSTFLTIHPRRLHDQSALECTIS